MKKIFSIFLTLVVFITACAKEGGVLNEQITFISEIPPEKCYLCSDNPDSCIANYFGQDNIGVIDINTFEILPVEINRYDGSGNLLTAATGVFKVGGGLLAGEQVHIKTDADQGYAFVDFKANFSDVDPTAISQYMCQNCLNALAAKCYSSDNRSSIALIDFANKEVKPLLKTCPWFGMGNYLVDCDFEDSGNISLFVVYRPVRFHDTNKQSTE